MMTRTWVTLLGTCALAVAASVALPQPVLGPGELTLAHRPQQGACLSCHEPLRGTPRDRCNACHLDGRIGLTTVAGVPRSKPDVRINRLHRALSGECVACHGEHRGAEPERALARFSHDLLPVELRPDCAGCHLEERPGDALHARGAEACGSCHGTRAWKPATYDHDRYFRFDRDHRPTCAVCHPGGDLKAYTCYGCHEHTPAGMAEEHREEGITNLAHCARCHRTGDKHDSREGNEAED